VPVDAAGKHHPRKMADLSSSNSATMDDLDVETAMPADDGVADTISLPPRRMFAYGVCRGRAGICPERVVYFN
jgi:hypothetical protein